MDANRDTLLDLIAAINDNRRFLEAAGLHARDAARKRQCQQLSRAQAVMVSRVTRDIALHDKRGTPLLGDQLEMYVDNLIESYTDDCDSGDRRDPPHAAGNRARHAPQR